MISYLKRHQLDTLKYDDCIANALQSNIYAFSWYLDVVADDWSVLVFEDYKAVMPLPFRKKWGFAYIYQPLWVLELGIFSIDATFNNQLFIDAIKKRFRFVEIRLNTRNQILESKNFISKNVQELDITAIYEVQKNYRKDRKKDLQKATYACLEICESQSASKLINLFIKNIGVRIPKIKSKDYQTLQRLTETCIQKKVGEVLEVYDDNTLVSAGFFLKHQQKISILFSATDINNRTNGANTFLINEAIKRYSLNFSRFNFGGSSIPSIANYFLSFGAKTLNYMQFSYHKLPFIVKIFKR